MPISAKTHKFCNDLKNCKGICVYVQWKDDSVVLNNTTCYLKDKLGI